MEIKPLDTSWKGKKVLFRYSTSAYYDAGIDQTDEKIVITLTKRPLKETVIKQFESTLLEDFLIEPLLYGFEIDGQIRGLLELTVEDWANRLRISNIFVEEAWRGKGIGRQLMDQAIVIALQQGRRALVLETQTCNDPAIHFYQSCGFSVIGCDLIHYSNHDMEKKEVRLEMGLKLAEDSPVEM